MQKLRKHWHTVHWRRYWLAYESITRTR